MTTIFICWTSPPGTSANSMRRPGSSPCIARRWPIRDPAEAGGTPKIAFGLQNTPGTPSACSILRPSTSRNGCCQRRGALPTMSSLIKTVKRGPDRCSPIASRGSIPRAARLLNILFPDRRKFAEYSSTIRRRRSLSGWVITTALPSSNWSRWIRAGFASGEMVKRSVAKTNLRLTASLILSCSFLIFGYQPAGAAAPLAKVIMTTGSVSEREGAVYVAQEHGFFRKSSVDVSFVQVRNGPVGMAALSSGETQFHWGSVSAANLGAIAEGADLVFVAGFVNRLTGMFVADPKIKNPMELKGKSIGVNSLSGGGWIFTMLTLDYWGLVPERDKIKFRSLGDQSVMVQGFLEVPVDAVLVGYAHGENLQ